MARIIAASIDLTKIDKSKITTKNKDGEPFKNGAKYLDISIIINDEENDYGQDCAITEGQTKEEREEKKPKNYLGNGKTVWEGQGKNQGSGEKPAEKAAETDGLPF